MQRKSVYVSSLIVALFSFAGLMGCNVEGRWRQSVDGVPPVEDSVPAAGTPRAGGDAVSIADAHEVDLVETLLTHRNRYIETLRRLRQYYEEHGNAEKEAWARFELQGLARVQKFRYLLDAEVPSVALRPTEEIPEADALYEKGRDLMRRGGHGIPGIYRQDRMIEAAEVFRELIQRYPNSDKIDDAAFLCGEIHKEYLPGQEPIAIKWYERAWTWNPQTPHPARFQAAVIYDFRLHDRDRALELYREVLKHEAQHKGNVDFATRRIQELTGGATGSKTTNRTAGSR